MTTDENKFSVSSWWASSPDFVLSAVSKQLQAAAAIWPELEKYKIGIPMADHQSDGASSAESSAADGLQSAMMREGV